MRDFIFQCMNPDCTPQEGYGVPFYGKVPVCPKCNEGPPTVVTAVAIHFAYCHPKGKHKGYKNRKFNVACGTDKYADPFNALTTYHYLVTCPSCRANPVFKETWEPNPDDPMSYFSNPNLVDIPRQNANNKDNKEVDNVKLEYNAKLEEIPIPEYMKDKK